uniref:Oxysterol-binding protein n=1 Tax=Acrobeloides nanus TaxID=290746 RepID=A0A914DLY0_9BILA
MEGPLSKWTNVVHGWQYRWFVLNDDVLCYYTSRDKMLRRQQRGCIRLRGAVIGIDGENNCLFTITVDGKVFHLQGKDQNERDIWVRGLERVIHEKCGYYKPVQEDPATDLNNKVLHAEKQLQEILDQISKFEQIEEKNSFPTKKKKTIHEILQNTKRLQNTIDHSIVLLKQVQRHLSQGITYTDSNSRSEQETSLPYDDNEGSIHEMTADDIVPPISYSSSEDEDLYEDALSNPDLESENIQPTDREKSHHRESQRKRPSGESTENEPDWGDSHENFDQIYENNEESDLGDVQQQHGSVLMHLLSQVSVGMDLTKVTLPTFILERRSLLEMYADFFAHPDDFIVAVDLKTPEERFLSVVRYYLMAFYPARKSGVAKKPYNPILGETFRCRWNLPNMELSGVKTTSGPFPGSDINQLTFVAEQVSHHPPVSAFYAEHPGKRVSFSAHIWTKSSFLGLSIGVTNIGQGVVTLHDLNEKYVVTFPNGYGRSIMTTPWVELGGKIEVRCEKTGYWCEVEFLTKPFFGGKPHKISGNIYKEGLKKPIMTLRGEWNGTIYAKRGHGDEFVFADVKAKPEIRKECESIVTQRDRESRRLWRHVTAALFRNKINIASEAKRWIEQRQRDETKKRQLEGTAWSVFLFFYP